MNSEVKKSLIALAALAAVSTPFAQVTVYGMADLYVGKTNIAAVGANTSTGAGLTNGGMDTSRLGFKAVEDLGAGMSAVVNYETTVNPDAPSATSLGDRVATLALSAGAHSLTLGTQYTPSLNYITCNSASDCHNQDQSYLGGNGSVTDRNSVSYGYNAAPLSIQVMNGFNEDGTGEGANATTHASIGGSYTAGPLVIGAAIESNGSSGAGKTASNLTALSVTYDFGAVKLGVLAGSLRNDGNTDGINKSGYGLSAGVPVGANAVTLSYGVNTASGAARTSTTAAYNLLYSHVLSKTTNFYTFYTSQTQDSNAALYTGGVANATTTTLGLGARKSF